MIAALCLLFWFGKRFFGPDRSRSAQLMNTYRRLTKDLLDSTPDSELVTAVVSNLLAKAEDEHRDPYAVIPKLSAQRCVVYSVWLFDKQLHTDDPAALRRSGQFGFSELAADGLTFLGREDIAVMLREYLQTADETLVAAMREAVGEADLSACLVELIRHNADAFCDD